MGLTLSLSQSAAVLFSKKSMAPPRNLESPGKSIQKNTSRPRLSSSVAERSPAVSRPPLSSRGDRQAVITSNLSKWAQESQATADCSWTHKPERPRDHGGGDQAVRRRGSTLSVVGRLEISNRGSGDYLKVPTLTKDMLHVGLKPGINGGFS